MREIDRETIVCECTKVTAGEIMDAIKKGCKDVACISEKTDAGLACRRCKSVQDDPNSRRKYHIKEDFLD